MRGFISMSRPPVRPGSGPDVFRALVPSFLGTAVPCIEFFLRQVPPEGKTAASLLSLTERGAFGPFCSGKSSQVSSNLTSLGLTLIPKRISSGQVSGQFIVTPGSCADPWIRRRGQSQTGHTHTRGGERGILQTKSGCRAWRACRPGGTGGSPAGTPQLRRNLSCRRES